MFGLYYISITQTIYTSWIMHLVPILLYASASFLVDFHTLTEGSLIAILSSFNQASANTVALVSMKEDWAIASDIVNDLAKLLNSNNKASGAKVRHAQRQAKLIMRSNSSERCGDDDDAGEGAGSKGGSAGSAGGSGGGSAGGGTGIGGEPGSAARLHLTTNISLIDVPARHLSARLPRTPAPRWETWERRRVSGPPRRLSRRLLAQTRRHRSQTRRRLPIHPARQNVLTQPGGQTASLHPGAPPALPSSKLPFVWTSVWNVILANNVTHRKTILYVFSTTCTGEGLSTHAAR